MTAEERPSVHLVENPVEIQPGDLLLRELGDDEPIPSGWTALGREPYLLATSGDSLWPRPGAVLRGEPDPEDAGSIIPTPEDSPMHEAGEPCRTCEPLRLWWRAWWEDES